MGIVAITLHREAHAVKKFFLFFVFESRKVKMSDTENAPDKMKVAELRAALQERGLDTKGTKPVLVGRLQAALDAEKPPEEETAMETAEETPEAKSEEKMESDESKDTAGEAAKTETPKKEEAKADDAKKEEEGKG